MDPLKKKIGFFGFGHMAQVMFEAIERAHIVPRSNVLFLRRDRLKMKEDEQRYRITSTSLENLAAQSDLIFLCFRPQQADAALEQLRAVGGLEGKWIVSILAGVKIETIQKKLGSKVQILRVLPNIASAVNEGMSILTFGPGCSSEFHSYARQLCGTMGEVAEVDESMMDITCGMSGSGPGFVFRLIETMARTGEKHGLPYEQSLQIAAQTFAGAAKLILRGKTPESLLVQITVPNGTTQAGIDVMKKTEMDRHFQAVIEATARRSKELSEPSGN